MKHFFLKWIISRKIICVERNKNALYNHYVLLWRGQMGTIYRDVRTKSSYRVDLRAELGIPIFNKPSRKEAIEARNRLLKLASDGVDVGYKDNTFGKLLDEWEESQSRNIKISDDYVHSLNAGKRILRTLFINDKLLTEYKLEDITTGILKNYVQNALHCDEKNPDKKVSASTCNNRWVIVTGCFQYAIDHKLISYNPTTSIKPIYDPKKEYRRIDPKDVWDVIRSMPKYQLEAETAIMTGARTSELRALGKYNVTIANRSSILIDRSLSKFGKFKKVKSLTRDISIGNELAQKLRTHLEQQPKYKHFDGTQKDLVFPNSDGDVVRAGAWYNEGLKKGIVKANKLREKNKETEIKPFTWHDLRHFYASVLIFKTSYSPATITYLMGHRNIDFTYRQYGIWLENRKHDSQIGNEIEQAVIATRLEN